MRINSLLVVSVILALAGCSEWCRTYPSCLDEAEVDAIGEQPDPEAWVHDFLIEDKEYEVTYKGQVFVEYYPQTDSMYVCVIAEERYDFGTISVRCLVPGTYIPEGENKGFAFGRSVKMLCDLDSDSQVEDRPAFLDRYQRNFTVSRIIPIERMRKLEVISRSDDKIVVEGKHEGSYTFDFGKTDIFPSRLSLWEGLASQEDEVLTISAMSNEEFLDYMFSEVFI